MSDKRSDNQIIHPVELQGLRALLAVADSGSFRSAAAELGYAQSAISRQVAELERAVEAPLFTRPGGRAKVSLTPAGEAAYLHARRALGEVHSLKASVKAAAHPGHTALRVGAFGTAAAALLPSALQALREQWPGVQVSLIDTSDDPRLADWLAEGRLDLALTINQPVDDRIEMIHLFEDPWVILTHRDSELATASDPTFELLDGKDVVAWSANGVLQLELETAWRKRGISPRVVYRTDDNLVLQRLVSAGLGDACVGRMAARRAADPLLTWLEPLDSLSPRRIDLCHPRGRDLDDAARTLSSALRSLASNA